jgi:O-antigen/teichoic acid export membrane protein
MKLLLNNFKKHSGIVWIAFSHIFLLISNLFFLKLLTTFLTITDFGYYSLCMTIILFIRQIIFDPISIVIAKDCSLNLLDKFKLSVGFLSVKQTTQYIALVFIIILFPFSLFNFLIIENEFIFISIMSCAFYLFTNGAHGLYINILNSTNNRKKATLVSIFESGFKLFFCYLIFNIFSVNINNLLIAVAVSSVFTYLLTYIYIYVNFNNSTISKEEINKNIKAYVLLSFPLLLPSIFIAFKSISDRWILAAYVGVEELAAYTVMIQIGYIPFILVIGILQTYIAPLIYNICSLPNDIIYANLKLLLLKINIFIISFIIIATSLSFIFSELIFEIFIGSQYKSFAIYLPLFVVAGIFSAGSNLLQIVILGFFETKTASKFILLSNLITIIVTIFLIYNYQFYGAIIALLSCGILTFIFYHIIIYNKIIYLK